MTLGLLVVAPAIGAPLALAQESAPDDSDAIARRAFEAGREAFASGDYDTALLRFREAYELSHRAGLLYNIAQSLDRLRRDAETLETLRAYLEAVPNTRSRAEVEARIRVLERMIARQAEVEEERRLAAEQERREREQREQERRARAEREPAQTPEAPPSRPPLHPALFITAAGLALAGGGVAVWSGLETLSLHEAYLGSNDLGEATRLYDDGTTYELITNVLIFSSSALAGAAILMLFFTDWGGTLEQETGAAAWMPTLDVAPDRAVLGALGRF